MPTPPELAFDAAAALCQGRRSHQEDALAIDFPVGAPFGFAVLADGMGGHEAGDVASKIAVTEVFSELKLASGDTDGFGDAATRTLRDAAVSANDCVRAHAQMNPATRGMGTTLAVAVTVGRALHWLSVGDSPLYLWRNGGLRQLNEDHSLAPQIDFMVETGLMEPETGANHPDRNCLTSVLVGAEIDRIDCPDEPLNLMPGDLILLASDGLQYLENDEIARVLSDADGESAARIAARLVGAVRDLDHPEQDNVSLSVIRVVPLAELTAPRPAAIVEAADPPTARTVEGPVAACIGAGLDLPFLGRRRAGSPGGRG